MNFDDFLVYLWGTALGVWLLSLATLVFYGLGWWWVMYAIFPGEPLGPVYGIINIFAGLYAIVGGIVIWIGSETL